MSIFTAASVVAVEIKITIGSHKYRRDHDRGRGPQYHHSKMIINHTIRCAAAAVTSDYKFINRSHTVTGTVSHLLYLRIRPRPCTIYDLKTEYFNFLKRWYYFHCIYLYLRYHPASFGQKGIIKRSNHSDCVFRLHCHGNPVPTTTATVGNMFGIPIAAIVQYRFNAITSDGYSVDADDATTPSYTQMLRVRSD